MTLKSKRFYPATKDDTFYISEASPILKHGEFKADAPKFCIGDIVVAKFDLWWGEESSHDMDSDPSYVFHDELDDLVGSAYLPAGSVFMVDEVLVDREHIQNVIEFRDGEDIEFKDGELFCFRLEYLFSDTMALYPGAVSKLAGHLNVSISYLEQQLHSAPPKERKAIYYNTDDEYIRLVQTSNFRTFFKNDRFNQAFVQGKSSDSWSVVIYTLPQYPLNALDLSCNFDSRYFVSEGEGITHRFGPELSIGLSPAGFAQRADQHISMLEISPWKDSHVLPHIHFSHGAFFDYDIDLNARIVTLIQAAHLEVDYESNVFDVTPFTEAENFASYIEVRKPVNIEGLVVPKPFFILSCKADSPDIEAFDEWFAKQDKGWLLNYTSFIFGTSKVWLVKIIDYDLIQSFTSFIATLSNFESHNIPGMLAEMSYFVAFGNRSDLEKVLDEDLSEYPTKYLSLVDLGEGDAPFTALVFPIFLDFVVDKVHGEDNEVASRFNDFLTISKTDIVPYVAIQTSIF